MPLAWRGSNTSLEYWNYLDRPETFIRLVSYSKAGVYPADGDSIGDSDDELGRMLAVLRFWFTKDLVGSSDLGKLMASGE